MATGKGEWPESKEGAGGRSPPRSALGWAFFPAALEFLPEQLGRLAYLFCSGLEPICLGQSLTRVGHGCGLAWVGPVETAGEGPEWGASTALRPPGLR